MIVFPVPPAATSFTERTYATHLPLITLFAHGLQEANQTPGGSSRNTILEWTRTTTQHPDNQFSLMQEKLWRLRSLDVTHGSEAFINHAVLSRILSATRSHLKAIDLSHHCLRAKSFCKRRLRWCLICDRDFAGMRQIFNFRGMTQIQ